jgi:hypothetical protein
VYAKLEAHIQSAYMQIANNTLPVWVLSAKRMNIKGFPDVVVLCPGGRIMFIEFKRPGAKPYKLQLWVHEKIRKLGFEVQVHDDSYVAISATEAFLDAA